MSGVTGRRSCSNSDTVPGYAQTIGKLQLRQPQGWQDIFPQHLAGVRGPAFFGAPGIHNHIFTRRKS